MLFPKGCTIAKAGRVHLRRGRTDASHVWRSLRAADADAALTNDTKLKSIQDNSTKFRIFRLNVLNFPYSAYLLTLKIVGTYLLIYRKTANSAKTFFFNSIFT